MGLLTIGAEKMGGYFASIFGSHQMQPPTYLTVNEELRRMAHDPSTPRRDGTLLAYIRHITTNPFQAQPIRSYNTVTTPPITESVAGIKDVGLLNLARRPHTRWGILAYVTRREALAQQLAAHDAEEARKQAEATARVDQRFRELLRESQEISALSIARIRQAPLGPTPIHDRLEARMRAEALHTEGDDSDNTGWEKADMPDLSSLSPYQRDVLEKTGKLPEYGNSEPLADGQEKDQPQSYDFHPYDLTARCAVTAASEPATPPYQPSYEYRRPQYASRTPLGDRMRQEDASQNAS